MRERQRARGKHYSSPYLNPELINISGSPRGRKLLFLHYKSFHVFQGDPSGRPGSVFILYSSGRRSCYYTALVIGRRKVRAALKGTDSIIQDGLRGVSRALKSNAFH
jgi:hypothetical protein